MTWHSTSHGFRCAKAYLLSTTTPTRPAPIHTFRKWIVNCTPRSSTVQHSHLYLTVAVTSTTGDDAESWLWVPAICCLLNVAYSPFQKQLRRRWHSTIQRRRANIKFTRVLFSCLQNHLCRSGCQAGCQGSMQHYMSCGWIVGCYLRLTTCCPRCSGSSLPFWPIYFRSVHRSK